MILSSETGKLLPAPRQVSEAMTPDSLNVPPYSPGTLICRISGTFVHENRSCLVFRLELRNHSGNAGTVNVLIDIYIYDTLRSKERTISKRFGMNPL